MTNKLLLLTKVSSNTGGWMTIKQRVEYQKSVLMYKCLSGLAPNYLSDLFQYTEPNHRYALRSINHTLQLTVPKENRTV